MMNQDRKSLFFVSLPKSGTVYTWNSLSRVTGLKIPEFHVLEGWSEYNAGREFSSPGIYSCGDYNTQLLRPAEMRQYLTGYIFGAHMQASYHNMKVLEECGIKNISVLLRDPRDSFVSWVYHVRTLGEGARNFISKIYHIPRDYYGWSLKEQFDFQIRTFLPVVVNWVEGWLDYYASPEKRIDVQFVLHDEMKRNPVTYIRRITEHQGLLDIDASKVVVPEVGKLHLRKGEHGQWKEEFTPANKTLAADLMQDRLARRFAAAAERHPGRIAAEAHLQAGNYPAAAHEALRAVTEFPNSPACYDTLLRAAEKLGANTEALRREIESELRDPAVEDLFLYRDRLVAQCRELVSGREPR